MNGEMIDIPAGEKQPLISVIIPTHRGAPDCAYRACGRRACANIYDLEIQVIVDGPDESTMRALAEIRAFAAAHGQVASTDRWQPGANHGVRLSQGKWVAFLDDDDTWLPTKLQREMHWFPKSPTIRH